MPVEIHQLERLPLFTGLNTTELEEMAAHLGTTEVCAGTTLISEGDPPGAPMFILVQGAVEVVKRGLDGRGHVISSLSAPSVFGEVEVLARRPAVATVAAITDVCLATLGRGVFDELCAANRSCVLKLVRNIAQVLSHRLAAADQRLAAQFEARTPLGPDRIGELRGMLYSSWNVD